jgi:hypothetical protein
MIRRRVNLKAVFAAVALLLAALPAAAQPYSTKPVRAPDRNKKARSLFEAGLFV